MLDTTHAGYATFVHSNSPTGHNGDCHMTTEVEDAPTTETAAPAKRKNNLTDAQKQAGTIRREASMLEKMAPNTLDPEVFKAKAKSLRAQADKLAPPQATGPADLTAAEWEKVDAYFLGEQFHERLRGGFSLKRLRSFIA